MKEHPVLKIHIDGASKGNPGDSGIGVVIKDEFGNLIEEISRYIGNATNNIAEYMALICALKRAEELKADIVHIHTDSELVKRQIDGTYQVKNYFLYALHEQAKTLEASFKSFQIYSIRRENNRRADELAAEAIAKRKLIADS